MPTRARKKRETYHHGDLSNALVAAALEVIAKDEQLTVREVSRRVGVNHRAVYRHFADLTSLLAAVAEQGYRQLLVALEDALVPLKKAPPEKRMEALACAYVAFAIDHSAHYRIMFGKRLNEDGRFPVLEELVLDASEDLGVDQVEGLEELVLKAFDLIDTEVLAGIESARFVSRPRRELVFAFWSLAHGFASLTLVRRIKMKRALVDPYVRQIVSPFIAGLRAL